jgi:tetratricopeptide (TPR) repeat protein
VDNLSAPEALRAVQRLQQAGEVKEALSHLDAALELLPEDLRLRIRRGVLLRQLDRHGESIEHLRALLRARPENLQIKLELAASLRLAGRFGESSRLVEDVLGRQPNHRGALIARADIAAQQQIFDEALAHLDAALEVFPDEPPLRIRRGALLRQLGRVLESREYLEGLLGDLPGNTALELELIRTRLELAEYSAAVDRIEAVAVCAPDHAGAHALWIAAVRASGSLTEAARLGKVLGQRWPDHPRIALERVACHLAMGEPEAAIALIEALPKETQDSPPLRMARANVLFKLNDHDAADALYAQILAGTGLHPGAVAGRLRVATERGIEGAHFPPVVTELRALVKRHETEFGHANTTRLLADIASQIGDWPELKRLCRGLLGSQPRDAKPLLYLAQASFGLGDADGARENLCAFLALNPQHVPALTFQANLDLATGRMESYMRRHRQWLAMRNANLVPSHILWARDLFLIDRADEALECLHACRDFVDGQHEMAVGQEFLLQGAHDVADKLLAKHQAAIERQDRDAADAETSTEGLDDLFDLDSRGETVGNAMLPATLLAWQLCQERPETFGLWRARAMRATRAWAKLARRPVIEACLPGRLAPIDLGPIAPLVAEGKPFLLVSCHFGPLVMNALGSYLPGVHYVVQRGFHWTSPRVIAGVMLSYKGDPNSVAVAIFKALRQGNAVISVPDVPIGLSRRGRPGGRANGQVFGIPCPLLDTVPKLSQEMRIPSFWAQARWRDGQITVEVAQLPVAAPGEARQCWSDRWAQAYLDKVADMMTSAPENQNLDSPMWRYLLLAGAGRQSHCPEQQGVLSHPPITAEDFA